MPLTSERANVLVGRFPTRTSLNEYSPGSSINLPSSNTSNLPSPNTVNSKRPCRISLMRWKWKKKLRLLKLTTAIIKWEIFSSFFHRWRMAAVKFAYLDSYALEGRDSLCLSKLPPPHPLPLPFKRSMLRWALSALQYIFANRDPSEEVSK